MAVQTISYTCGCGFRTSDSLKASAHSDNAGHTLTAIGMVKPEVMRPVKPSHKPKSATSTKDFDELRKKLVS